MSENDTPAEGAETSTEGSAPASSETSSTSVETAANTGGDSAPTTEGGGSADGPTTEESSFGDWNGEVESVQGSDWFNSLGASAKQTVLTGLENKYKNWQRGYTDKFQEMSTARKRLKDREDKLKESEMRVQRWLYGEADPIKDLTEQIKTLQEEKLSVEENLKAELQKAVDEAQKTGRVDYDKILSERDSALSQYKELQAQIAQAEEAALEAEVDDWDTWLRAEAPDLYEDFDNEELLIKRDEAFSWLCKLATTGMEKEMALAMVRSHFPKLEAPKPEVGGEEAKPPAAEPEPVPDSVSLMNMGTGHASNTTASDPRSFDEILDAMRRAAQTSL